MANYIGSNDFRGYLNYLGSQGDTAAKNALQWVGGDYAGWNSYGLGPDAQQTPGINVGALAQWNQGNTTAEADRVLAQNALNNVNNLYGTWGTPVSTGGAGGGPTAPAAPVIDWQAVAAYDQGIGNVNTQLGQIPGQRNVGLSNIDTSYNSALNQLLQGKARSQTAYDTTSGQAKQDYDLAKSLAAQGYGTQSSQALQDYTLGKANAKNTYDTTKLQTGQDYVGAKNTIGSQAGTALNSLLRLLGSRGAGGGSAYNISAPGAVARQATIQRNDVGHQFGRNQQALDTTYNTGIQGFNTTYGRNKNALDTSYNQGIQGIDQSYGRNTNALETGWQNYLSDLTQNQNDPTSNKTIQENDLQAGINRL